MSDYIQSSFNRKSNNPVKYIYKPLVEEYSHFNSGFSI